MLHLTMFCPSPPPLSRPYCFFFFSFTGVFDPSARLSPFFFALPRFSFLPGPPLVKGHRPPAIQRVHFMTPHRTLCFFFPLFVVDPRANCCCLFPVRLPLSLPPPLLGSSSRRTMGSSFVSRSCVPFHVSVLAFCLPFITERKVHIVLRYPPGS